MADYNVQMKQYNGTSFDNILPHAYLADTATELAGVGGATEIIAQARAGLSQIATGSYVGNGIYTSPTQIVVGFKPKILVMNRIASFSSDSSSYIYYVNGTMNRYGTIITHVPLSMSQLTNSGFAADVKVEGIVFNFDGTEDSVLIDVYNDSYQDYRFVLSMTENNGVVSISQTEYAQIYSASPESYRDRRDPSYQFNANGEKYFWVAFA